MEKGYLIVSVYENNEVTPISDATVIVRGDNYEESFTTDENGKTKTIELDAPLKIYSLTPQSKVRPYSVYEVTVSKPGYETTIINGVQIFSGETSLQNIYLTISSAMLKAFKANVINIPPHSLWESEESVTRNNPVNNDRVLPQILIPEYIIVHGGAPSDTNVANYYVSFIDYIKNVASGEIYSTWPKEAIRANIYAILSFTMNRIYTEWYKSQGYNFTITSSPKYDQVYVHNRTIFKTIADIVDQIFKYHIQLPNKNFPFLAQYNDGIKTNNPGWLSQWGAKDLADKGYTATQILKYYYIDDLSLVNADKINGLPTSFPGFNLRSGSCNEAVQKIQIMINTINGSYPGIPKIIPADGQYKDTTIQSIRKFQEVFNLPVTGIVDFATWYRISYIYIAVRKMLQGVVSN